MFQPWQRGIEGNTVVLSTAAAVLCALAAQKLSHHATELPSEALCWTLLPLLYRIDRSRTRTRSNRFSGTNCLAHDAAGLSPVDLDSGSLWIVAGGSSFAALCAAESTNSGFLPALTPLLYTALRFLEPRSRPPQIAPSPSFASLIENPIAVYIIGIVSIITVSHGDFVAALPSLLELFALAAVYIALSPRVARTKHHNRHVETDKNLAGLRWRAVLLSASAMGFQWMFFGFCWPGALSTAALSFVKAGVWYFTMEASGHTTWLIAPLIKAFALVAVVDFGTLVSEREALFFVVASWLSLGQIVGTLPKKANSRIALGVLGLVTLAPYLINTWTIQTKQRQTPEWGADQPHPVEALIRTSRVGFADLLQRQSTDATAAGAEYRRRYGVEPPPGFDAWFAYARQHNSPILDEYDALFESVSPFLSLSGKNVMKLMTDMSRTADNELWLCAFSGKTPMTHCTHSWRRQGKDRDISALFNDLLGKMGETFKGVNILVNHLDEPRVVSSPGVKPDGHFKLRHLTEGSTWSNLTRYCSPTNNVDWNADHPVVKEYGLPFVANRSAAMDLCQHPEHRDLHGLFVNPTTLRLVEGHVPILSTGAFSTMGDILFPSPAYIQSRFAYQDTGDVEWHTKSNNLYWDGSSTGGFATGKPQWLSFHRQRFITFAQGLLPTQYYYLRNVAGRIVPTTSSFLNGRLYDVAFTLIMQCDASHCREQRHFFRTHSWTRPEAALRSRLVFDLDGNGISGRFYRLLASRSLPLKQTLLREWHDERLVPWVHYVPVSQTMEELPELVFWLTSTVDGQRYAREMAEAGREWHNKALRDVDKSVYLYRLLLELKRLQDPDRSPMSISSKAA